MVTFLLHSELNLFKTDNKDSPNWYIGKKKLCTVSIEKTEAMFFFVTLGNKKK